MNEQTIKPGIQTTEFWQTLLVNVIAILTLFGVRIPNADSTISAIAPLVALLASAIVTHGYVRERSATKRAALRV